MLQALAQHDGATSNSTAESLQKHGFGPNPLFRVILAERDAETLGLALFFPEFSSYRGNPGVFVQDIYVKPTARKLGIGRGLLVEVAKSAQDWDATFIALMVQRGNTEASAFYAQLGFVARGDVAALVLDDLGKLWRL